jgi:hypothetical protein
MTAIANYQESTSKLQLEEITQDDANGFATNTPVDLSERLIKFNFKPKPLNKKIFADGKIQANLSKCLEGDLEIELTGLTAEEKSVIFGTKNVGAIRREGDISDTPYFVVKRQVDYSSGKIVGERYLKVKFQPGDESSETATTEKISADSIMLKGTAQGTIYVFTEETASKPLKDVCDNMDPLYNGELATWFTQGVSYSAVDVIAPTFTTLPLDAASDVALAATYAWTFNKAILPSTMTAANFFLYETVAKTLVAGALAIGTSNTVVTFTPTAPLTATTEYAAVVTADVKSKTGIPIAATHIHTFTTLTP